MPLELIAKGNAFMFLPMPIMNNEHDAVTHRDPKYGHESHGIQNWRWVKLGTMESSLTPILSSVRLNLR
jgi:hypothetical protein